MLQFGNQLDLAVETHLELRVVQMFFDARFEALERGYQRLRHVAPAEGPEATTFVR